MRILQKALTLHKDFQMPRQVETSRIKIQLLGSHFCSVSFDLKLWLTFLFYSSHRQVNHSGKVYLSTSNNLLVRLNSPNLFHLPLRPKTPRVTKVFCQHNILARMSRSIKSSLALHLQSKGMSQADHSIMRLLPQVGAGIPW